MRSLESVSTSNDSVPADPRPLAPCSELYVRSRAIVSRLIGGETLILPVRGNVGDLTSIYTLNETATKLWEALETPKSFKDLRDVICRQYDLSREHAEEDVAIFIREICSLGLADVVVDPKNGSAPGHEKSIIAPD
jgi:coenzyme PQQ synthesis protein D (PqqD)